MTASVIRWVETDLTPRTGRARPATRETEARSKRSPRGEHTDTRPVLINACELECSVRAALLLLASASACSHDSRTHLRCSLIGCLPVFPARWVKPPAAVSSSTVDLDCPDCMQRFTSPCA